MATTWIEYQGHPTSINDLSWEQDVDETLLPDIVERNWEASFFVRRRDLHLIMTDKPLTIVEQHDGRPATRNVGIIHKVSHEDGAEYASVLLAGSGMYAA